jgi:hypothetical protein
MTRILSIFCLAVLLCGCATTKLKTDDLDLSRVANALAKTGVGTIVIDETRTNNTKIHIQMRGYTTESADTWAGVVAALADAFKALAEKIK